MSKKHTIKEVREFVESQGYTLISDVYVNNKTPLEIMCDKGHKFPVRFDNFKSGQRCPVCYGHQRKTIDEIKEYIESVEGYKLLSTEYINNRTPLKILCDKGHEFDMEFDRFKNQNQRCPVCGGTKKKTYKEVKEYIESVEGYKLLSKEYINNNTPLDIKCPEGHIFPMSYNNFQQGNRCKICSYKLIGDRTRHSYDKVKSDIESVEGYKLLSTEYVNSKTPLKILCPEGHKFDMRYHDFMDGHRCPTCMGSKKYTIEEVREFIENEGYKLLSTEYINSKTLLNIKCPEGHVFPMSYNNFKVQGHRCPTCMKKVVGEKNKLSYEEVKNNIESIEGYKLLSTEYINNSSKLDIECPEGHVFPMSYNSFSRGRRCPECNNNSKGEEEIKKILEKYNISKESQYRFYNCRYKQPLPFDFYIPEINTCIEYDGIQHFKPVDFTSKLSEEELLEQFKDVQLRDQIKTDYCRQNGIKLIRIPYTEFDNIEEILIKELNLSKTVN